MVRKKEAQIGILKEVMEIATYDAEALATAEKSYGNSWEKRGGVGAFMMLARKWDRIENQVRKFNYNIFDVIYDDPSPEGILDDIGDLRRYLFLVEARMREELGSPPLEDPQGAPESNQVKKGYTPLGTSVEGKSKASAEGT